MAGVDRCANALHHARKSLGEWLLWIVQSQPARRAVHWRNLLQPCRSANTNRGMATTYNTARPDSYRPPASEAVLWPVRPSGSSASTGEDGDPALTINTDHSMGADHFPKHKNLSDGRILWRSQLGNVVIITQSQSPGRRNFGFCGLKRILD